LVDLAIIFKSVNEFQKRGELLGYFFLICHGLAFTLSGTGIVLGPLTPQRQAFPMALPPVTSDIHQAFDIKLNLRAQFAFYPKLVGDELSDDIQLLVGPFANFGVHVHAGMGKNFPGGRPANSVNVGEADFASFVAG
jgi:hypothetical protein